MDDRRTAQQIHSAAIQIQRALRRADERSGLTAARLSALSVLVFDGPCSIGTLAAAEDVTSPTMTRIVDGLHDAGLVRRKVLSGPGRPVQVSATARGERLARAAAERRDAAITAALACLNAADQRRLRSAGPVLVTLAELVRTP